MTRDRRWEVGGDFHWAGMAPGPFLSWPEPSVWFSLGRHGVLRLIDQRSARPKLWLPSYFCPEVTRSWSDSAEIQIYEDSPGLAHPKWETLSPSPDDLVIAVNYFGMHDGVAWTAWKAEHPCILIEDHSHDPHSVWALTSKSDYAFSAVRKVMPVPDGAVLWSPAERPLPSCPTHETDSGSGTKLAAMLFKSEYLASRGTLELKEVFRRLQLAGEACLERAPVGSASSFSLEYLARGAPQLWRTRRRDNARALLLQLQRWSAAAALYPSVCDDAAPFGVPLVFPSEASRNYYREYLRSKHIYCPIHWVVAKASSADAAELSSRMITIPCDHRYSASDMQRVAETLVEGAIDAA